MFPLRRAGLIAALGLFFFLFHSPLLSVEGRVRGFNSDAAIIALMGKKMLEGRGFDVFFWGQNYVGPLTSMCIAAAGAFTGGVNPLALRLGTFAEVFAGILLVGWSIARIDRRAAIATMIALAITPPVLLRMMITPLGAEMSFVMGAALLAVVLQHVTSPRGWLSHARGQFAFGVVAAIGWWMNQQVVFTLLAAAIVLASRSAAMRGALTRLRLRDRWMLRGEALRWRRMPGVVQAFAWISTRVGALLF
nr:hypothetical protein [Acidobacteriota bacterium]